MKPSTIIPALVALFLASQTRACVHSRGTIIDDPIMGWQISWNFDDNGFKPCNGGNVHQDKNGVWIMDCKPGYHLTFSKTGTIADYAYGNQHFQWKQEVKRSTEDAYGACEDRKGVCIKRTNYDWDTKNYC